MKTVTILETFEGYPNGEKRRFVAGETPTLSDTYADLLIGKRLADELPPKSEAPTKATKPEKQS